MALASIAVGIIEEQFMNIAEQVQAEFKAEVHRSLKHPENSSGQAEGSIEIRRESVDRILVGSDDQHLNFLIRGNGSQRIRVKNPRRHIPLTYGANGRPQGYAQSVSPYAGKPEILTRVANKFR